MNSINQNKPSLSEGIVESIFTVKYSTVREREMQKQSIIDDFRTYRDSIGSSAPYPEITNYIFENSISELDSTLDQIENMRIEESCFDDFIESFKNMLL